jgi:hypothetical protein
MKRIQYNAENILKRTEESIFFTNFILEFMVNEDNLLPSRIELMAGMVYGGACFF